MPNKHPLLTIAIPTYNRSKYLALLLESLALQLINDPRIELIISDNASDDATIQVVESFRLSGMSFFYQRNENNIGADANFVQCLELAAGKYIWIIGDDDLILPGGIQKVLRVLEEYSPNLVFIAPEPFRNDTTEIRQRPHTIPTQVVTDPTRMIRLANLHADLVLISSVIVDKEYISARPHPPFASLVGTNLVQLGWTLSCLRYLQRGVFMGLGVLATKVGNSGGFHAAKVFGENYNRTICEVLGADSKLANELLDDHFRIWFPRNWHQFRDADATETYQVFRNAFQGRFKYWIFAYPIIRGPRWFSFLWSKLLLMRAKALIFLWSEPAR